MSALADISKMTDIDRVTKLIAEAANGMRQLEAEASRRFNQWIEAQEAADAAGLVAELKLGPGLSAMLAEHKQRKVSGAAKLIVSEEFGREAITR